MSTLVDDPPLQISSSPSERLQATMAAVRVSLHWLGVRKTLSRQQKTEAAQSFGADGDFLSAGKKLLDTRHPAFQAVTAVRHRIGSYWKGVSLPFPEPGIRLIRHADLESFDERLSGFQRELARAVEKLDAVFHELQDRAGQRLGRLYNAADYPESLVGLFAVGWDYPSVEAPNYLRQLHPELYEEECRRASARFREAVHLAEEAFATELALLVNHLRERLSGASDGKPKIFRDSAVSNLQEFFGRFRALNIGSSVQLDRLVREAQEILQGVDPGQLRDSRSLRSAVAQDLTEIEQTLATMLVDRPRRNILRRAR